MATGIGGAASGDIATAVQSGQGAQNAVENNNFNVVNVDERWAQSAGSYAAYLVNSGVNIDEQQKALSDFSKGDLPKQVRDYQETLHQSMVEIPITVLAPELLLLKLKPILSGTGKVWGWIGNSDAKTVSIYRKVSEVEGRASLKTQKLQESIANTNSSKYLSEDLAKVQNFQNKAVDSSTKEMVLEFKLDRKLYEQLTSTAVNQKGSRGVDAVKINYEGITNGNLRNLGIPPSKLEEFNKAIKSAKQVGN